MTNIETVLILRLMGNPGNEIGQPRVQIDYSEVVVNKNINIAQLVEF